jgi:hypothetical protein
MASPTETLADHESRIAALEQKLAGAPAPGSALCLRCGADAKPVQMRPSVPGRFVFHCDRCAWDFEK